MKTTRDKYLFLQVLENPQNIRWMERVASDYLKDRDMFIKLLLDEIDECDKISKESRSNRTRSKPPSVKTHFRETSFSAKEERNGETRGTRDLETINVVSLPFAICRIDL